MDFHVTHEAATTQRSLLERAGMSLTSLFDGGAGVPALNSLG